MGELFDLFWFAFYTARCEPLINFNATFAVLFKECLFLFNPTDVCNILRF